jgi:hypothetical protein
MVPAPLVNPTLAVNDVPITVAVATTSLAGVMPALVMLTTILPGAGEDAVTVAAAFAPGAAVIAAKRTASKTKTSNLRFFIRIPPYCTGENRARIVMLAQPVKTPSLYKRMNSRFPSRK